MRVRMTDKNKFLFVPILAVVGVIYSALFPVNQMSVEIGLPYIGYVFWFNLLATLMLFIVCAYKKEFPRLTWPHIRAYLPARYRRRRRAGAAVHFPRGQTAGRHHHASPGAGAASHLCNIVCPAH